MNLMMVPQIPAVVKSDQLFWISISFFLDNFFYYSGCDDLLPILSFVVIRSGMAQLVSECDAMEEFIPEG